MEVQKKGILATWESRMEEAQLNSQGERVECLKASEKGPHGHEHIYLEWFKILGFFP